MIKKILFLLFFVPLPAFSINGVNLGDKALQDFTSFSTQSITAMRQMEKIREQLIKKTVESMSGPQEYTSEEHIEEINDSYSKRWGTGDTFSNRASFNFINENLFKVAKDFHSAKLIPKDPNFDIFYDIAFEKDEDDLSIYGEPRYKNRKYYDFRFVPPTQLLSYPEFESKTSKKPLSELEKAHHFIETVLFIPEADQPKEGQTDEGFQLRENKLLEYRHAYLAELSLAITDLSNELHRLTIIDIQIAEGLPPGGLYLKEDLLRTLEIYQMLCDKLLIEIALSLRQLEFELAAELIKMPKTPLKKPVFRSEELKDFLKLLNIPWQGIWESL